MKAPAGNVLLLLVMLVCVYSAPAQDDMTGFRFGYLNSTLIYRPGNIEASINDFNARPTTTTHMELPKRLQGMHFGFDMYREVTDWVSVVYHGDLYLRKLRTNTAIYTDNGQQDVRLKMKMNSIHWAGVGVRLKFFEVYASFMDVTFTTIAKKESATEGGLFSDYVAFYEKKKSYNFGQTIHAALILPMGKMAAFELRGIYQTFWFPTKHGMPFRPENFTLSANLCFKFES